jgi:hypothetical protein
MRNRVTSALVFFAALIALAATISRFGDARERSFASLRMTTGAPQEKPAARVPVVVELFTSEGCSSCPPADALLARLARTQPVEGAEIIALKLHVDYWNRLGWTDPFSSAAYSARQSRYAETFDTGSVYTPQMVVDGRAEFVGSAEAKALAAIAGAARAQKSPLELHVAAEAGALTVNVRLPALAERTPGEAADVFLAITEDKLHSNVTAGENAGRALDHMAVVRSLRSLVRVQPGQPGDAPISVRFALDPAWKRDALRVVAFVQEEKSRHILAAASAPL